LVTPRKQVRAIGKSPLTDVEICAFNALAR